MNLKLGKKIRALRKSQNISQEVLAQYLGVSFQLLQAIAIAEAVKDDIIPPFWHNSIYEYPVKELLETIQARLQKMI